MFKITKNGKTIVGNNEDFWNQNTRIWFEQGDETNYGVAYVGFDDFWPQGAMNEVGLVFDGFSMPYLEIKDTIGKKNPDKDFLQYIMKTCTTVDEVKEILISWNLTGMETSMFYFVDNTGKHLIAEGDSLMVGFKAYDIVSNFYPSQVKNLSEVKFKHYQKGRKLIENYYDTSIKFSSSLLDSLHQETDWGGGTLYSTVYDLNNGLIYLYYFHNYEHMIIINLKEELAKENHFWIIPELFPMNTEGLKFYNNYNIVRKNITLLKENEIVTNPLKYSQVKDSIRTAFRISIFESELNDIGYLWLNKKEYNIAISVFSFITELCPNSSNAYNSLGEAFAKNGQTEQAIKYYQKSIEIDPDNIDSITQLKTLKN